MDKHRQNNYKENELEVFPKKLDSFRKELIEELKTMKQERRYHNVLVPDPLSPGLEVPRHVLNERDEIADYIDQYRYNYSLPPLKNTENEVLRMQREAKAKKNNVIDLYCELATK